ncbi:MAG: glycosyltransferase family 2 protein, partial [Acidianus infernus]|nr:glycosyltransferase family 2 protein [Acidianus infernus]
MQVSIFLGFLLVFSSLLSSSWLFLQVYYIKSIKGEGIENRIDLQSQNKHKISIIIAIRNEEADTINELIQNLRNIDYDNYEVIIISDDPPEKFREILSNIS